MKPRAMKSRLFGVMTILVLGTLVNGQQVYAVERNHPPLQFSNQAVGEITGINFERGYLTIDARRYGIDPRTLIVYSSTGAPLNVGRLEARWKVRYSLIQRRGRPQITEIHLIGPVSPPNE